MSDTRQSVKPCPFCGEQGALDVHEGSTFRWMLAECGYCGAQGPEVRIDTMSKDRGAAIAQGRMDAIAEWNKRTTPAQPVSEPALTAKWSGFLHYPECWDTAAYPTLESAIHETLAWSGCSVCKPPAPTGEPG
jgi:Lar family restriction alleviation protein